MLRISLLAGEMRSMHLSSSGALLSGAASIRLYQLVASVLTPALHYICNCTPPIACKGISAAL